MRIRPKLFLILFVFFFTFILSACQPTYSTRYSLTSPVSAQGKRCVVVCQKEYENCKSFTFERCRVEVEEYQLRCRRNMRYNYHTCLRQVQPQWSSVTVNRVRGNCEAIRYSDATNCDLEGRLYRCGAARYCNVKYRRCFKSCGGGVEKQVRCVSNCDKMKRK